MAKTRKALTKPKRGKAKKKANTTKVIRSVDAPSIERMAADEQQSFANTLYDPCNAKLNHGVYRGPQGQINRFQSTITVSLGATNTAYVLVYIPATGNYSSQLATSTASNVPFSLTNVNAPGGAYYTANCSQMRSLGACAQLWSDLAPLNITGNIALGTIPLSQVSATASISTLIGALGFRGKLTADVFEQKWYPGMADEFYQAYNVSPSADTSGDLNVIVAVLYGLPVNSTISLSMTNINEWCPRQDLGMQAPTTVGVARVAPQEVVAKLNASRPNWYTKVGRFIEQASPHVLAGAKLAAGVAGLFL